MLAAAEKAPLGVEPRVANIVLTGNPNCGKTTLFNALTGLRAKVSKALGVPVYPMVASAGDGVAALRQRLLGPIHQGSGDARWFCAVSDPLREGIEMVAGLLENEGADRRTVVLAEALLLVSDER